MKIQQPIQLNKTLALSAQDNDKALRKACREFESVLVAQMLHKMRDSVPKTDLFGSRDKEEIFQGMLDDEVAKNLSNSGSLRLADMLYQQLSKNTAKVSGEGVDK